MKLAHVLASAALAAAFLGLLVPVASAAQGTGFSVAAGQGAHAAIRPADIGFNDCTDVERSAVVDAVNAAVDYVGEASDYLAGITAGTARYTTWFGQYRDDRKKLIESRYEKIGQSFRSVTYDCGSTCASQQEVYAYVYPNDPTTIYLCGAFWNSPLVGANSQGGTLVHEETHFTVNGGTRDDAYGHDACQQLAIDDPDVAIANADNDEYFVENDPRLA